MSNETPTINTLVDQSTPATVENNVNGKEDTPMEIQTNGVGCNPSADQTPAKRSNPEPNEEAQKSSKKRRTADKFLKESQELLKSLGVGELDNSDTRRTRSRSRGGDASFKAATPTPVKRSRRSAEKKETKSNTSQVPAESVQESSVASESKDEIKEQTPSGEDKTDSTTAESAEKNANVKADNAMEVETDIKGASEPSTGEPETSCESKESKQDDIAEKEDKDLIAAEEKAEDKQDISEKQPVESSAAEPAAEEEKKQSEPETKQEEAEQKEPAKEEPAKEEPAKESADKADEQPKASSVENKTELPEEGKTIVSSKGDEPNKESPSETVKETSAESVKQNGAQPEAASN